MSWPKPSRYAVTPRAETAGSLEISTVATLQAGITRQPRLKAIAPATRSLVHSWAVAVGPTQRRSTWTPGWGLRMRPSPGSRSLGVATEEPRTGRCVVRATMLGPVLVGLLALCVFAVAPARDADAATVTVGKSRDGFDEVVYYVAGPGE